MLLLSVTVFMKQDDVFRKSSVKGVRGPGFDSNSPLIPILTWASHWLSGPVSPAVEGAGLVDEALL